MKHLTTGSASKLLDKVERLQATAKRHKEALALSAERGMAAGLGVAGGAAVGAARHYLGDSNGEIKIPGTEIDADAVAGAALIALGISGVGGKASESCLALGTGVMAGYLAFATKKMLAAG